MKLRFEFGGAKYSAAGIFEFTKTSMTDFWREPFFHFYPDVDRKNIMPCPIRNDSIFCIHILKHFTPPTDPR